MYEDSNTPAASGEGNGWDPPAWSPEDRKAGKEAAEAWEKFFKRRAPDPLRAVEEIARIRRVRDVVEGDLLRDPNVVGVATSLKVVDGKPTDTWCLTVYVEKKKFPDKLEAGDEKLIAEGMEGVPTDVVEVGRIAIMEFNAPKPPRFHQRVRPALPGYSIGHAQGFTGTFGCLVHDLHAEQAPTNGTYPQGACHNCEHLILSNYHVLVPKSNGQPDNHGESIVQPGRHDGPGPDGEVAKLVRWMPIDFNGDGYNLVDAAVARPTSSLKVSASIVGSIIPRSVGQAVLGDPVIKVGRTTGLKAGRVIAVDALLKVDFPQPGSAEPRTALFLHQIVTTMMADYGDSGSLLMARNLAAVGLVFAGSPLITAANHIADVETALGVRPVTAVVPSSPAAASAPATTTVLGTTGYLTNVASAHPVPEDPAEDGGPG